MVMGSLAQSIKDETKHSDICDVGILLEKVDNDDREMIKRELGPNKILSYPQLARKINEFYPLFKMSRHKLGDHARQECKCFRVASTEDKKNV